MKKKSKKNLMAVGIALLSIIAIGTTAGLINAKTGVISGAFTEVKETNGRYELNLVDVITAKSTTDEKFNQEIEMNEETSPFSKVTVDYKLYGSEKNPATIVVDSTVTCSYVEEIKLTFSLKDKVDFYIGSVAMSGFDYSDSEETKELTTTVKVGRHDYDSYTYSDVDIYMNKNVYSDDVVVKIKNPLAKDKKAAAFTLGEITFNYLDLVNFSTSSN